MLILAVADLSVRSVPVLTRVTVNQLLVGLLAIILTVIAAGLTSVDRVIVNGLQQVWPGMTVAPNVVPMPRAPSGAKSEK